MRAFIALPLSEPSRQVLTAIQQELLGSTEKSTVVPPENFHLTLSFLGNIDDDTVFALEDELDDVRTAPQTTLNLGRVGSFNHAGSRTLWITPAPNGQLDALHAEIVRKVESCGIALEDRPFKPHITLARNVVFAGGEGAAALEKANAKLAAAPISVPVASFALMQSTLGSGAPLYQEICSWE